MNSKLVVDINKNGDRSRLIKTAPSTFALNSNFNPSIPLPEVQQSAKKQAVISKLSSRQKGDISEARIAELITLYGDTEVSCFKPISDDDGIDLIVKPKGQFKTLYIQIKSRFGNDPTKTFTATVKTHSVVDNYSMVLVFCYFNTIDGDISEYLWLIPAPDFMKKANKLNAGKNLGFVAGRKQSKTNKWDDYLIDKTDLSAKIIEQLNRF
jgi:hypothetical protein